MAERDAELLAYFDFDISLFDVFLSQIPEHLRDTVRKAVRTNPFIYTAETEQDSFPLSFSAYLSEHVIQNEAEYFLPLNVTEFN